MACQRASSLPDSKPELNQSPVTDTPMTWVQANCGFFGADLAAAGTTRVKNSVTSAKKPGRMAAYPAGGNGNCKQAQCSFLRNLPGGCRGSENVTDCDSIRLNVAPSPTSSFFDVWGRAAATHTVPHSRSRPAPPALF